MDGEYLNHLRFADDIVLIANNPEALQQRINELNIACNEVGLKMNLAKTKIMYNELIDQEEIQIDNTTLEIVDKYIYLGHLIHNSGSLFPEINRRIKLAWRSFGRNTVIFKSRMPFYLNKRSFDQCILTYGCETWILQAEITSNTKVYGTKHTRNNQKGS